MWVGGVTFVFHATRMARRDNFPSLSRLFVKNWLQVDYESVFLLVPNALVNIFFR